MFNVEDHLESVDIVIITPFWEAESIIAVLNKKGMNSIVLDDLVYSTIAIGEKNE